VSPRVPLRRVLVVGAGGMGGYFAAVLSAGGADVTLLSRGENAAAMHEHGLRIENGPDAVTVRPTVVEGLAGVAPFDLVLVATKAHDTEAAVGATIARLADRGAMVALQNGVGRGAEISALAGRDVGLDGVIYLEARLVAPGVVRYFSGARRVEIGDPTHPSDHRAEAVAAFISQHGFTAVASADPVTAAWRKLVLVSTANAVTAATRKPFGEIVGGEVGRSVAAALLSEATAVAVADGAALPDDFVSASLAFLIELGPQLRSSMLHDVERGRRTEVDALNGEVVRRARRHAIPTPSHELAWLVIGDPDRPEEKS
jgi:2-dehydropantoate 2-reductase